MQSTTPQKWILSCLVFMLTISCVHQPTSSSDSSKGAFSTSPSVGVGVVADSVQVKDIDSFRVTDLPAKEDKVEELEVIPTEINPMVEKWISYFQGRGRPHMERYLARSGRYEKLMKKVLRDQGLPEDLFYIALIESGFNGVAKSHAAAVGYWQFIRGTGKRYGLEINPMVDERRDPVLATQAAAEYFKGLYSYFGSWYLAMASYNVGENRVKREVVKLSTNDFWELVRKKRLPKETMNYVPKFIAAKIIAKDPDKYGFGEIDYLPPIEFDHIAITQPVSLRLMAEKLNFNYEDLKALNPKFKGVIAPLKTDSETVLRIPPGMIEQAKVAATESVVDKAEFIADAGDTQSYKVRRGDTLNTIARKFRTTVAYLRDLNDLPRKKRLSVGSAIYVPDRTPLKEKSQPIKDNTQIVAGGLIREGTLRFHIVQYGDSLYQIASKYNVTLDSLKKVNNLKKGKIIKVGTKILIPGDDREESRTDSNQSRSGSFYSAKVNRYMASTRSPKNKIQHNGGLNQKKKHASNKKNLKR